MLALAGSVPARSEGPTRGSRKAGQPQQTHPDSSKRQARTHQRGTEQAPLIIKAVQFPKAQAEAAQENQERQQKAANDRKLVEFTGWLVIATLLLAAIALLQAGVFGLQARRLRQTVETIEKTERRSLRAYVGVSRIEMECANPGDPTYVLPALTTPGVLLGDFIAVKIKNFGPSPAKRVSVFAFLRVVPGPLLLPGDFFAHNDRDTAPSGDVRISLSRLMLFPGQSAVVKVATDVREVRRGHDPANRAYVYGRIYYHDIYNRPWRTKFCYTWEPYHAHGQRFVPYEECNDQDQVELLEPPPSPTASQPAPSTK